MVAADTVVDVDGIASANQPTRPMPLRMLRQLSGGSISFTRLSHWRFRAAARSRRRLTTRVRFYPLDESEIAAYVPPANRSTKRALTASKAAPPLWSRLSTATFIRSWVFRSPASFGRCGGWDFRCRPRTPSHLTRDTRGRSVAEKGPPIFTYRDERRLFALISLIIVTALVALVQINAERTKTESPIATCVASLLGLAESAISLSVGGARSAVSAASRYPARARQRDLARDNRALAAENARLHELAAAYAAEAGVRVTVDLYHGVEARVVGFQPENELRSVTIDRGTNAGVRRDDGVVGANGVVGRIASVAPFTSTVVLITDYTSRIPAIVRQRALVGNRAREPRKRADSSSCRRTRH